AGVHQLLLARVERVALAADLDVQLRLRGTRLERVPARAVHVREDVLRVDVGLHAPARIAEAVSSATLPPLITATAVSPGSSLTAIARASGLSPFTAVAMPEISPPPPTCTSTTSTSGTSSTISSPTVPWPAMISGSSNGWTSVRPDAACSSSRRANASGESGA